MKEELLKFYTEFIAHINMVNARKNEMGRIFEDDIETTFENFMTWLSWKVRDENK